ncbi:MULTISPECIES: UDP-glucose 4-epimerase family protein [unclassified Shewanella]|uniref:UDP-glucose 4-epimerase family protein n=1 Tax=unclassified Shewanella TaxID=196818 RepID=UPI0021DAD0A3|nr:MULTISPECIES: SDR family oxidoreductase [unclassified Shewanella]MCU8044142.1 SDR family oxidoreductase [Shewanella sp. SM68]MCU8048224.1 SDR family oxidoreductase [Shewanella sp. SM65]
MILLTGSTGFIGSQVLEKIPSESVVCLSRCTDGFNNGYVYFNKKISPDEDYKSVLYKVETIIHCAARAHVMNELLNNPLDAYREVNTLGTLNLASQAAYAGVKRFIFISSIKVNGECTSFHKPFTADDIHNAQDNYGISKSEAEQQLLELGHKTGMEIVIIRPTLVYGPGVKANFASLMNLVSKGVPLPFGCINHNKRSLLSVTNLVDLIITCIDHPKAANQVFLVSDDHDVSTSEMVREMAKALDKPTWQLPIPIWCYKLVGKLFDKSDVVDRLTGSLQVDISHTKETLGWKPPQTLQEGFKQTAQAFLQAKTK